MATIRANVVQLSARLGPVLPVGAVRQLHDGTTPYADSSVPDEVRAELDAAPAPEHPPPGVSVLLTTDAAGPTARSWRAAGAELLVTPEPPGAALLDAVAVMNRLRSPGGCPWDAEQTHASLMPYLIEETYELYQALEDGDRASLREELGDVLLQVLFHARVAAEDPVAGFDIDGVAADLVAKLIARHPHVFAGTDVVRTAADQQVRWEQLKRSEKQRESSVDGVALGQPAAALTAKLAARTARAGLPGDLLPGDGPPGARLFGMVARARLAGEDPEAALRTAARRFAEDVRAAERSARAAGLDTTALTPESWRAHWPTR